MSHAGAGEVRHEAGLVTRAQGPSPGRAVVVMAALLVVMGVLAARVDKGEDDAVRNLGRIEVTARLLERPERFPELGAYRYTYVLRYAVLRVHRSDPENRHRLEAGDEIYVGHYQPWLPRAEIRDADWGSDPLGGRLVQFVTGEAHRMALEYELQDWAPSGVLDYLFPAETNRFFAIWTNPTTY
ncbi:MAG: hypothetical protein KJ072_08770 [Verrucomicrobia bacterium]|nr:hypothetical protein [Verrucomicrobiota bacterium]